MDDLARWMPAMVTAVGAVFSAGVHVAGQRGLREKVQRHDKDLYHGDARKPGLTTRMERVEGAIEDLSSHGLY